MNQPNTASVEMPKPATPANVPAPQASQQKKGHTTYVCEACGQVSGTRKDGVEAQMINGRRVLVKSKMWALKNPVGHETEVHVFCTACKEAGEQEGMQFAALDTALSFIWRVSQKVSTRDWLLSQCFEIEMRVSRPDICCGECGKPNGFINNQTGRITVIAGALPIDTTKTPIQARYVCLDCRGKVWPVGTEQPFLYRPHASQLKAAAMEKRRLEHLAWESRQAEIMEIKAEAAAKREEAAKKLSAEIMQIKAKAAESRKEELRQQGLRKPGAVTFERPIRHEPVAAEGTGSIRAHHKPRKTGTHG